VSTLVASLASKRAAIVAVALLIAAVVGVTVLNNRGMFGRPAGSGDVAGAFKNGVQAGVNGVKAVGDTVASLFDSRSPGERMAGLLANMKQKRQPALHQRALPKMRKPVNPLAGIVGAVPTAPPLDAPVIAQPLDKVVNGTPSGPVAISPPPGGVVGGPGGGFPGVFVPGGGGGGVIIPPPAVNPPVTPPVVIPPTTSGVPEPGSWAMMLIGFVLIGSAVRRSRPAIA
jgi:hypothetical protein